MTWIVSTLLIVLSACNDSAPAPTSSKISQTETVSSEKIYIDTPTDKVSPRYKNGTNNQNRGDKTGKVTLHGNISVAPGSMMYLYVTEARNKALLDSTEINGGEFSFKNIEVSRGFYELVLNGKANNKTQIILNPDESDVYIDFKSSRLTGTKLAPDSDENTAWFEYIRLENINKKRDTKAEKRNKG